MNLSQKQNPILKLRNKSFREQPVNFRCEHGDDGVASVYLYDVIDSYWGINSKDFNMALDQIDADTINLFIDSPGGDVFQARAMATGLQRHKAKVQAHVDGLCASAATTIACACDTVTMARGAFYMIHKAWAWAIGNSDDMMHTAELLEKADGEILNEYVSKTGADREELAQLVAAETWFTAEEALDQGFVDSIFDGNDDDSVENLYNLSGFQNTPGALLADTSDADEAAEALRLANEQRAAMIARAQHIQARSKALTL